MRKSFLLLLSAAAAYAQSNVASVTGIITDPSGGVVANATILITNINTGISARTVSNEAGIFLAPSLLPGKYTLEVSAGGFKRRQVRALTLEAGQRLRLDLTLEVGDIQERIEVQAQATPLQQESSEISDTISSGEIRNMPLNGRTPYSLLVLSAGISGGGNDPSNLAYDDQVSINGSRTRHNAFVIDGASTVHIGGIPERIGSIESIQEFKVMASTYSAEFGRTSGGVVAFQVKAGTQDYHGTLYEYHRNNLLNAANWENNARGVPQSTLVRNEFGGTFGGSMPGTRKRLFFFLSYEGIRDRVPVNRSRTIPDPALRGGNFSSVPVVINDPLAGRPFPGNIIPQARLDTAALNFMKLYPQPNTEGIYNPAFGIRSTNWLRSDNSTDYKNFGIMRWDYNMTDSDKVFVTFSHINEGPRMLGNDFDNELNTTIGPRFRNIRRMTAGYTRILKPTLTNEFLAFAQRDPRKITPFYPDFDTKSVLGIDRVSGKGLPIISISGGWGSYGNSNIQDWVHQPAGLSNIMSWLKGRHSFRFGGQLYQNQFWYRAANSPTGSYSFNGEITGLGLAGRDNPVNSLADFELGAVKGASIPVPQIPVNRVNYNLGLFFNDDWKVTKKLTLNLGLRYEFELRQWVKNNVYSSIDLVDGNLLVAGQNASRNLNLNNDFLNFSPRLGIAYSFTDKTVLRSGFGVFHSNLWVDNGEIVAYPGWTGSQSFVDQGLGRAQPFTFQQGFPVELVPPVTNPMQLYAAATPAAPLAVSSFSFDARDRLPYSMQWNFGLQRHLGFDTVVDVSYVASRSVNLNRRIPKNNPSLEQAPLVVINRVPIQQVRPFPRVTGFNASLFDALASYHSFQIKATRRFSHGFSLDTNYTFSKSIDNASGAADSFQIPWQFAGIERSLSSLDRTHVLSLGWVYDLPFGAGRRFSSGIAVLDYVIGGFSLNGLAMASSGVPVNIRQANTNTILSAQRPDAINAEKLDGKVSEPFFQGAALRYLVAPNDTAFPFRASSNVGIGNLGRNTSREPGFINFNFSLFKNFPITEKTNLEFRWEAYNALNHVNWLEPASSDISNINYGLITGAAPARVMQLGLRLSF
jgi:hypothetical protein